jgi:O-antigen/teichoic acid export membrane protein
MASMLNAKRHYTWGNLLTRLPNSLLILPAIVMLVAPVLAQLNLVLLSLLISLVLVTFLALALLIHHIPRGIVSLSLRQRADGLVLLATSGTQQLPLTALVALAGAILLPAQLATYAAIAVLVRPFRLLSNIFVTVLTPELIRQHRPNYTRMLIGLLGLAALAGVFTVFVGPALVSWAYAGRYDHGVPLIPILALAGSLRLVSTLPRSYLIGRADTSILNRYIVVKVIAVLVAILLGILLTVRLSIVGLAVGIALIELTNTSLNYLFLRVAHRQELLHQSAS